jgi:hypothetical protein
MVLDSMVARYAHDMQFDGALKICKEIIFGTKTRWRYNGWSHANPITKTLLDNVLHAEGEFNEFGELFGIVE